MALSLLKKLFCKTRPELEIDTKLIESYALASATIFLKDRRIYHLKSSIKAKTILLDAHYGLYVVEVAHWQYSALKGAKATLASHKKGEKSDIAVDELHEFIARKFNEVLHKELCPIINILYMPNITHDEFHSLDKSFHTLLPTTRLIFKDSNFDEIKEHLHHNLSRLEVPLDTFKIQSALFVDTTIIDEAGNLYQADESQKAFIFASLEPLCSISGDYSTGKSSTIILKIIKEKLDNPSLDITLIVPTQYAADTMRTMLLQWSEYAIVDLAHESIRVITTSQVGAKLKTKGLVFCDDAHLLTKSFMQKILKNAKEYTLCFVGVDIPAQQQHFRLKHRYKRAVSLTYDGVVSKRESDAIEFLDGNIYMNAMLVINKLLAQNPNESILIVVDEISKADNLQENINDYYGNIVTIIDTTLSVAYLERNQIEILLIDEVSMFTCRYVIAILEQMEDALMVNQAISRCTEKLYLLQEKP